MDAPCNLQESIHVLVTKYLFVSSFWGTHHFLDGRAFCLFFLLRGGPRCLMRKNLVGLKGCTAKLWYHWGNKQATESRACA